MSKPIFSFKSLFVVFVFAGSVANATDLQWGGLYRFEGNRINNPELSSNRADKAYMLHHLVLAPKIVVADGMTVFGRFDMLNNSSFGQNNQTGEFIGKGPGTATPTGTSNSNVLSRNQESGGLAVTQLYMSWAQEFGQMIVGRAPLHFGLGTFFNAGRGDFDHYLTTLDMVGYKVIAGNFFIMPILGKVNEGAVDKEDDVNDYMLHFQYDNPETELSIGLLYQIRIGSGNDADTTGKHLGGTGTTKVGDYKHNYIGLFSSQKVGDFTVGVEAGMLSGETGLRNAGQDVKLNGFGIAGELNWAPEDSKVSAALRAGFASGDDPGTNDSYESFTFSRNYRVAALMFTHPLGQRDFLRTGLTRDTTTTASSQVDTEAISNVLYIAPSFQVKSNDKWSYGATFVTGRLNKEPFVNGNTSTDLGYELDMNVTWKPFDRFTWINEAALLFPGEAWRAGSVGLENAYAYGLFTKAAVRF